MFEVMYVCGNLVIMSFKAKKCGKNVGKLSNNSSNMKGTTEANISLTPELEQQFETELCWCIQQIQIALKSDKLNKKQEQEHIKALNTLMNNSAPLVKKRQVMRLSFGDYRAKMVAEEKKYSKSAMNMRVKQATPSKKSVFVKKSNFSGNQSPLISDPCNSNQGGIDIQNVKHESSENSCRNKEDFTFLHSNNSFRFSFNVNKES